LLPSWWSDEIANSKAGFLQTVSLLAKNLDVDLSTLLSNQDKLLLKNRYNIKFKKNKSYDSLTTDFVPQSIAARLYSIVLKSVKVEYTLNIHNSFELRKDFFSKYAILNLNNLLDFLWSKGLPIIFVSEYPRNVKRLDGMAIKFDKRPIIVISNRRKHEAWLTFILAHELGHILLNHLDESSNIVYDSDMETSDSKEEKEANKFAIGFLIEDENNIPDLSEINSSFQLANKIRAISKELKTEPGLLALMYAYRFGNFPLASQALNILYPEANATAIVLKHLQKNLLLENLSEEDLEYFEGLTSLAGV
jgi:Zn-dependent peptidase ImmA (M78 family)